MKNKYPGKVVITCDECFDEKTVQCELAKDARAALAKEGWYHGTTRRYDQVVKIDVCPKCKEGRTKK